MKVHIGEPAPTVALQDVPEDEWLVVYKGDLCIRDPDAKGPGLFTVYGEAVECDGTSRVRLIKSINVEL